MFASWWEMLVVLFVVVLLFGTKRLPELGAGVGKAIRNFKHAVHGEETDSKKIEGK